MSDQELIKVNSTLSLDPQIAKQLQSWEDHISYYLQLDDFSTAFSWAKADLLLSVLNKFGDTSIAKFAKDINQPSSTISCYVRAAKAFPAEKRVPGVSFTHHFVASFADRYDDTEHKFLSSDRFKWVEQAADTMISTRELRKKIDFKRQELLGAIDATPCAYCNRKDVITIEYSLFSMESKNPTKRFYLDDECWEKVVKLINN